MNIYEKRARIKLIFLFASVLMVFSFLYMSHQLVNELSQEERKKMEIWAMATEQLASDELNIDASLILKVIQSNTTIPVLIADSLDNIISYANLSLPTDSIKASLSQKKQLAEMKSKGNVIQINIDSSNRQFLYFNDSILLRRLSYYPYLQLGVMLLFIFIAYMALMSTKKAEQNQVWVGLSKETAHQLGTPISSLMAWVEYLKLTGVDPTLLVDMEKDIHRLTIVAERFSKVGSPPQLEQANLAIITEEAVAYMRQRTSTKVIFEFRNLAPDATALLSIPLLEWVIENIVKNAIDAMSGEGKLTITIEENNKFSTILIADTGKGIARKYYHTVFNPGFTTKKRGWGLGLSLAKRIIEEYFKGKIGIKESELEKGTTFYIQLPNAIH